MNAKQWRGLTNAQKRGWLASRFLDEARAALMELHRPHTLVGFTNGRAVQVRLQRPPSGEKRNLMIAAAVAVDKSLVLERHDSADRGLAAVDAWLREVIGTKEAVEG